MTVQTLSIVLGALLCLSVGFILGYCFSESAWRKAVGNACNNP
jgi:uncharacterized protein YneF (UPF0154 family)